MVLLIMDLTQRSMALPTTAQMVITMSIYQPAVAYIRLQLSILAMIITMSMTTTKSLATCIPQTSMAAMVMAMAITTAKSQAARWSQASMFPMAMAIPTTSAKRRATLTPL